jgi:hypothetical protein
VKGLFRRPLGALLAASTLVGIAQPLPSSQQAVKARTTSDTGKQTPAAAVQNVAMKRINLDHGVLLYGERYEPIWRGRAKAARRGKARWDYRR